MTIEMKEAEIKEAIVKMHNSPEYLALKKYFSEDSFLKTLHVSREEKVHSNFIAWLLSPEGNHGLRDLPMRKFLQMLAVAKQQSYNEGAYLPEDRAERFLLEDFEFEEGCTVETEVPTGEIAGFDKTGRIDILIHLSFKGEEKCLPIIIENKVLSSENKERKNGAAKGQTDKYYDWGTVQYGNEAFDAPLYLFLAPDYERDIHCSCEHFIKISYQNLVDYVIEPCLVSASGDHTKFLIEDYLRCLSNSTLDKTEDGKENRIMAFTAKELALLKKFHEKNKDLFDAVLTMLERDEEIDEEDREKIRVVRAASSARDYSRYVLEGTEYPKSHVLEALVKRYLEDHPAADAAQLKGAFPLVLSFNKKPVILLHAETTEYMRKKDKVSPVTLPSDGSTVYINKQAQIGDMPEILQMAKNCGYDMAKI